jgi:hypothetical protein
MKFNIPNIRAMWVEDKGLNQLLLKWNIFKKERNLYFLPNKNRRINRYLNYQWKRLSKSRKLGIKFSKISLLLLKRSKSFRILALSNVRANWYKDLKLSIIKSTMHKLNGICHRPRDYYRFERVAIPKPDGGTRFLTVPSLEMRLYLWMTNMLLHFKLEGSLNPNQFGHRKGMGLVKAWQKLADNVDKYKHIVEFDYKKFHDTINRDFLNRALYNAGLSLDFCRKIVNLQGPWTRGPLDPRDPNIRAADLDKFGEMFGITPTPRLNRWNILQGVPQGANTSALLGILALEYLKVYDLKDAMYIGYADDGVILTNSMESLKELELKLNTVYSGIRMKPEKTGWVKIEGKWKKSLKFLGCEWTEKGFYSNTHSGKKKRWDWDTINVNLDQLLNEWRPLEDAKPSGWRNLTLRKNRPYSTILVEELKNEELAYILGNKPQAPVNDPQLAKITLKLSEKNPYAGLLFAKLFAGESDKKADRDLKWVKGSWLDKTNQLCKLENASSYAILGLCSIWKKEWSVKMPLKYKGKMVDRMKVDEPGFIDHPLLSDKKLAQLSEENLYQPHYAQPTPFYPKNWKPELYPTLETSLDRAKTRINTTINPGSHLKTFLLFENDFAERLKTLFKKGSN